MLEYICAPNEYTISYNLIKQLKYIQKKNVLLKNTL